MYTQKGVMPVGTDELLSAADIAREAGVHRSTVGGWFKRQKLQPVQERAAGSRINRLYRREDVQQLINDARARAATSTPDIVPSGAPSS